MFPRDFYEILHIVGIAMLFVAIGGVATHAANGGTKATSSTRPLVGSIYGIGAFLILLGGFGMLARLGFLCLLFLRDAVYAALARHRRRFPGQPGACTRLSPLHLAE